MKTKYLLALTLTPLLIAACEENKKSGDDPPITTREIKDQALQGSVLNTPWEFEFGHLIEDNGDLRLELYSEAVTACEPSWWKATEAALVFHIDSIDKVYTNNEPNLNILARDANGAITLIPSDVVLAMSGTREGLVVGGLAVTMQGDVNLNGHFALVDCRTHSQPEPPAAEDEVAIQLDRVLKQWWTGDGGYFNGKLEDRLGLRFVWQDNDENTSIANDFDLNFACINGPRSTDWVSFLTDQNDDTFYLKDGKIFQRCWSQTFEVGTYSRNSLNISHISCWNRENEGTIGPTALEITLETDRRMQFRAAEWLTPSRKGNSCSGTLTVE